MTTHWTLTLKTSSLGSASLLGSGSERFDGSSLSLNSREFDPESIRLGRDGESLELTDLFDVESKESLTGDQQLDLVGDLSRFDWVGANHQSGRLLIDGNVGHGLGAAMSGGWIQVTGTAGDRVGGAWGTARKGMTGGRIEVIGNVGDEAGFRTRRGEVMIGGHAGDFLGAHMIAGTIVVAGRVGAHAGYAMRRGSLLLSDRPAGLSSPRFSKPVVAETNWINLIAPAESVQRLLGLLTAPSSVCESIRGDMAVSGAGEILYVADA